MENNWGGRRPGSGRKKKKTEQSLVERLTPIDDVACRVLTKNVKAGEPWAVKLFFQYRYGMPVQMQPEQEVSDIIINVNVDKDADPASEIAKQIIEQTNEE